MFLTYSGGVLGFKKCVLLYISDNLIENIHTQNAKLYISEISFEGGTLVLISSVPGHCLIFFFFFFFFE